MTRYIHRAGRQRTNAEMLAVSQQAIKLRTICRKIRLRVKNALEYLLHRIDVITDGRFATQMLFQIRRRRQMIGMGMGLEYPIDRELVFANKGNHLVSRIGVSTAGLGVVIQNGVDNGAG